MAHLDESAGAPRVVTSARIVDWFEGTRLAELIDTVRRRPDTLGTLRRHRRRDRHLPVQVVARPQDLDYFVRLADAFLHGRIYLTEAPSWLNELIPKDGVWYVAYPPLPAVILVPFVALFGTDFPPQIASCIFGGVGVGLAWLVFGGSTVSDCGSC